MTTTDTMFLFCCSFILIGLAIGQDESAAVEKATIRKLMDRIEYLEKRLQAIENDPLAAYFSEDHGGITKRNWEYAHSRNSYHANGSTFVFCGSSYQKRSTYSSTYSHSYNDYINANGTFVICGGGDPAPKPSGVSYIVWGKQYCPNGQTLYSGILGGNYVKHSGGGSNQVCLPDTPKYDKFSSGAQQNGKIYPGKYETQAYTHLKQAHGKLVRCAACYNSQSSTLLMIPATVNCPREWNQEYSGYLMTQPTKKGSYRYIVSS